MKNENILSIDLVLINSNYIDILIKYLFIKYLKLGTGFPSCEKMFSNRQRRNPWLKICTSTRTRSWLERQ